MGKPGTITDLTGQTFGRATVVKFHTIVKHKAHWLCRCSCGTEWVVSGQSLVRGHTQSCGCYHRMRVGDVFRTHGKSNKGPNSYVNWQRMHVRCYNPNAKEYKNYGGRGIRVCARWKSFANFYADMGERPFPGATIERLKNNENYGPDNCAWRDRTAQANNTRKNIRLTFRGTTMTVPQWAAVRGMKPATLHQRLRRSKWSVAQTLGFQSAPPRHNDHKSYPSRTYKPFPPIA